MERVDTKASAVTGRPTLIFVPEPRMSSAVPVAAASLKTRAHSRSSMGRMLFKMVLRLLCRFLDRFEGRFAPVERKDLRRIEQPAWIEHGFNAHLLQEI